jgi:cysteine desulfurase
MFEKLEKLENYLVINTPKTKRLYNTLNFSFKEDSKIYGEDFLLNLDMNGICASSGSACSSSANLPSHVIMAQHSSKYLANNAIRISLGMENTQDEVQTFLEYLYAFINTHS